MGVFSRNPADGAGNAPSMPRFATRAEAFAYMVAYQLERGKDPMEATQRAGEFADIFAKNMMLPDAPEPEQKGIDKYLISVDKLVCYCEEHPKVVEFLTGAITFAAGTFFGRKAESKEPAPCEVTPIDHNNLT